MTRNAMSCRICSSETEQFLEVYDDRYGYPGSFLLDTCTGCGHISLRADFEPKELERLYSDFYPRSQYDVADYSPAAAATGFRAWLDGARCSGHCWVPENVRVLDIGCGFGETLGYHKARGCDVRGVEADENIRRVADRYGFQVTVGLFSADMFEENFFDYVTMDQVIEHVSDPVATLKGVATVLKPGGLLILSTPNPSGWGARIFGRHWINWHAPYHTQHFTPASMARAAGQAGLAVERTRTITSSEWLHYQWIHLLLFPAMGQPSPFWTARQPAGFGERQILRVIDLVHRTGTDHLITRFFDGVGWGDNRQFFLRKHA